MKYHVWTEGCQMNVADSQRVSTALENLGYTWAKNPADADVIVLNTCVVRQSAEDKAYGRLSSLKPLKKNHPGLVINLMGCLVGVGGNPQLRERFPYVDVFSGPSDPQPLINHLLNQTSHLDEKKAADLRFSIQDEDEIWKPSAGKSVTAFVPIVLGCSHACAYCVIPGKRGKEKSRPVQEILQEIRELAVAGVKEVTLLGQIVDRYGKDTPGSPDLPDLLREVSGVDGIERIRFLTSHPLWMTDRLLETVASLPKVMPHIEVPIQAGDDEVLRRMRRGYTNQQYRALVARIRAIIPGCSIGTDVIVGFPGESEEQFQRTVEVMKDLKMDVAHLARYSPRAGTVSAETMPDDVPDAEKWRRFRLLEELQEGISSEIHHACLGHLTPVLFEDKKGSRWRGRNPNNRLVFVESGDDLLGRMLEVKITWAGPWSLVGELV